MNIAVKTHLPTTVTQCWIQPRESAHPINDGNGDISRNGSCKNCYSNTLYEFFNPDLPLYITWSIVTSLENLSPPFALSKVRIEF